MISKERAKVVSVGSQMSDFFLELFISHLTVDYRNTMLKELQGMSVLSVLTCFVATN